MAKEKPGEFDWLVDFCEKKMKDYERESEYIRVLVLGRGGAGKTTFASTAPNPLWLNTDFGMSTVGREPNKLCFKKGESVLKFTYGFLSALEKKAGPFAEGGIYSDRESIIIDSLHKLSELIFHEIIRDLNGNPKDKSSFDSREAYRLLLFHLTEIIDRFKTIDYHLIVTCGVGTKEQKEAGLQKSDTERILLNMPLIEGQYREKVQYEFDEVYLAEAVPKGKDVHYIMRMGPIRGWDYLKSRISSKGDLPRETDKAHFKMYNKYLERVRRENANLPDE